MNCKAARGFFSLYVDGGLSFEEQGRLDLHLEGCPVCALELKRLRKTVEILRDLPAIPVASTFVQEVVRAAREANRTPQREPTLWERLREKARSFEWDPSPRLALAGASLLILGVAVGVGGGVLVFGGHQSATHVVLPIAPPGADYASSTPVNLSGPSGVGGSSKGTGARAASRPFEDLIQQMMHRMDTAATNAGDTATAPPLDWRSARITGPIGQPVDASPNGRRDRQSGGRVYIDF